MKTNKKKSLNKKFDLEKMKVAKLENVHSINGGDNTIGLEGDIATVTQTGKAETKTTTSY